MIRLHCTDIDQVGPQHHKPLPKHAMTAAIPALISDERVDVGRVEPDEGDTADGIELPLSLVTVSGRFWSIYYAWSIYLAVEPVLRQTSHKRLR